MGQQRGTAPEGHDQRRMHDVTDAEGPGSPGGLGKHGRAVGLERTDAARAHGAPAEDEASGTVEGRGLYEAGAEVRDTGDPQGRGVAEAMAAGRFGQTERPRRGLRMDQGTTEPREGP